MDSPSLPMDVRDINVCLLSAKKKSTSSPSLRELDQINMRPLPTSISIAEDLAALRNQNESSRPASSNSRKRPRDYDTQSVQDFNFREPSAKKVRRPLAKVSLFGSMVKDKKSPLVQAKRTLKRSLSFSRDVPGSSSVASKYRMPSTPKQPSALRRSSKSKIAKPQLPQNWVELVGETSLEKYSKEEIKRQEAIYSIFKTESEQVDDLRMIINIFYHPLLRLNLVSEEEHCKIFGNIHTILSLHEDLLYQFEELRSGDVHHVDALGELLLRWSKSLMPYAEYCANLITAKQTLEAKKHEPAFQDFLQRCLDSEFSRKIDLWTFLDSPRSRIMKYPILLKEVKKKTPPTHVDQKYIEQTITAFDSLIKDIDRCTGIAKCRDIIDRLDYLHDEQKSSAIDESQFILCSGVLRNKNNSKLHVFLFNKALILTRPSSRTGTLMYQVYRQPIPVSHLLVEDLADGESRLSGSFRGVKTVKPSTNSGCKHLFKISCTDVAICRHTHTLQANGDYDKKAWLNAFKSVVPVLCSASSKSTQV